MSIPPVPSTMACNILTRPAHHNYHPCQWLGDYPHHDLIVCCSVWSLFLFPSVGKNYALNPVEFTEVQDSGNRLQSSTSAEVTYGFQCDFFLAWVGTSSWAISGFRENIFMFSYPVMENRILFSTRCILHPVFTVLSTVHPSPQVLTFFRKHISVFLSISSLTHPLHYLHPLLYLKSTFTQVF